MRHTTPRPGRPARPHDRPATGGLADRAIACAIACAAFALLAGCSGPRPAPQAMDAAETAAGTRSASGSASGTVTPATAGTPLPAEPGPLAEAIRGVPVVLLGEMHDNPAHHALRAAALARVVSAGARPALAFEQFDRERQAEIEQSRRERPRDADALIARAGGRGWDWPQYRPFVQLALDHNLPIVAANLSRADASRVVRDGFGALFDARTRDALGLDALAAELVAAHERAVVDGHCGMLPPAMVAPMARAQIARDVVLAASIAPHAAHGVVLLTGNGHARRDLGVARWLPATLQGAAVVAVGLLETGEDPAAPAGMPARAFDRVVLTGAPAREDPCASLRGRVPGTPAGAQGR